MSASSPSGLRPRRPALRELQHWLAAVTAHPRGAAAATRGPRGRSQPDRVLAPPANATALQRLQVHNTAFWERLLAVLASDYPALQRRLGEPLFRTLARAYLLRHPSAHPNLNRLGRRLPDWLARQRREPIDPPTLELARYEQLRCESFDAPEAAPLDPAALAAAPPELLATARLRCHPSLRLATFRHPVHRHHADLLAEPAHQDQHGDPQRNPAERHPTRLAILRDRTDRLHTIDLAPRAHAILTALRDGRPLLAALATARPTDPITTWFATLTAAGAFTSLDPT